MHRSAEGRAHPARRTTSVAAGRCQPEQATATARAAQISRIRASATRPRRSTRIAIETLSIESRLTAERSGTGSFPGSRRTSLGRFRMLVVHGAMSARRWRGMTASRDKMTTGLRPISGISHHHTSPRAGRSVMRPQPPVGTRPSLPTRRVRRAGARRRRRSWRPLRPSDGGPATQRELRPPALNLASRTPCGRSREGLRPLSCSGVCDSCHNYATSASRKGRRGARSRRVPQLA